MPCSYPKRSYFALSGYDDEDMKLTSFDLVRLVNDLPYLPEKRALEMQFTDNYISKERKIIKA